MKKYFITGIASLICAVTTFAQNSAVVNAKLYYDSEDYENAKQYIDQAVEHEKTKDKSKTWNYRGMIYAKLGIQKKSGELLEIAAESHQKCIDLNENKGMVDLSVKKKKLIYNDVLNLAYELYKAEDMAGALGVYESGIRISPKDTLAYIYASSIAIDLKEYDKLIKINQDLLATGFTKEKIYFNIIIGQLSKETKEDSLGAIETMTAGIKSNPGAFDLAQRKINLQIRMGKRAEALASIEEQLAAKPEDEWLWYLKGGLQTGQAATESYLKSHSLINENTSLVQLEYINFSVGNIYYNEAAEIYNKVSNMGQTELNRSGKKMKADAKIIMEKAIPYLEKALETNDRRREADSKIPKAYDAIQSLVTAYFRVGREADSDKMGELLK